MVARGSNDDALQLLAAYQPVFIDPAGEVQKLAIEAVALTRQKLPSLADEKLNIADHLCRDAEYSSCGEVLRARGILAVEQENLAKARQYFSDTLAFANNHRDKFLAANAFLNLGWTAIQVDHFDEAMDWSRLAIRLCAELGAEALAERASGNLGWAYFKLGDTEQALDLMRDAENRAAKLGDTREEFKLFVTAGDVYEETGDFAQASRSYGQALTIVKRLNSKEDVIDCLEDLAHASIDTGQIEQANSYLRQLGSFVKRPQQSSR